MLEHMKRYDKIFEYASRLLKPGAGKMLVHVFCNDRFVHVRTLRALGMMRARASTPTHAPTHTRTHTLSLSLTHTH